ncbi:MAG: T9SS type A sorting domain-containing protein [Bacteroidota bacterium]
MMKQLLLVLSAAITAGAASGQEKQMTMLHNPMAETATHAAISKAIGSYRHADKHAAHKTTAATERWYSFVDYFDTTEQDNSSSIALAAPYLWNDTMSVDAYSATGGGTVFNHNTMVSLGTVLHPFFSGFNDHTYYNGEMKITSANAYILDSITIFGRYGFNPAKSAVVDTIRISIVYGNGASTADVYRAGSTNPAVLSRFGLAASDTLYSYRYHYDSVRNRPSGTTVVVKDIILNNSGTSPAWGDTLSNGTYVHTLGFTPINIPAGNLVGAAMTFISGDASFVPHDTVFSSTMGYKYNMLRPYVAYRGTASTPQFPTYNAANGNTGLFKTLPNFYNGWIDQYIPLWFWSSGTGAATSQYPYIDYHLKCATCGTVYDNTSVGTVVTENTVTALPNPATDKLTISYSLTQSTDVTITLTNLVGQAVASQTAANSATGNVVFNTAALTPGLYFYTVSANGGRTTGRVVVAH